MKEDKDFLRQDNNYRTLKLSKKRSAFMTWRSIAHKFLKTGDRTIDQMIQAARSGKQNLAEGNINGITSREMELKLTNVNRASLHELMLDYPKIRNFAFWLPICRQKLVLASLVLWHADKGD